MDAAVIKSRDPPGVIPVTSTSPPRGLPPRTPKLRAAGSPVPTFPPLVLTLPFSTCNYLPHLFLVLLPPSPHSAFLTPLLGPSPLQLLPPVGSDPALHIFSPVLPQCSPWSLAVSPVPTSATAKPSLA